MNVLLVCAVGMSSSMLADKTRDALHKMGRSDIRVGACGSGNALYYSRQADLVVLAPQISFMQENIEKEGVTKVIVLPADVYGSKDGERIAGLILHPEKAVQKETGKVTKVLMKLAEAVGGNRVLLSVRDGMSDILPVTLVGSVLSLVSSFPIPSWTDFLSKSGIGNFFTIGYDMTIGLLAVYTVLTVSYHLVRYQGKNGTSVGLSAMVSFFIVTGAVNEEMVDVTYLGANGLFTAILVAAFIGYLFPWLEERRVFETPGIPGQVMKSLRTILPCLISILCALTVHMIMLTCFGKSLPQWIDETLIDHISSVAGISPFSYLVVTLIANLLWFFGLHGGQITGSVTTSIYSRLSYANIAAWNAGQSLPYMVVNNVNHLYTFGGAGSTLPLSIVMALRARSKKYKTLGKLTVAMGFFFINEPVIFGFPMMLNPIMAIPFILIPIVSGALTFFMMSIGVLPYMAGFDLPWTTPPVIFGLLQGSVKLALWQILMLVMQCLLWYPFLHYADKVEYAKEKK